MTTAHFDDELLVAYLEEDLDTDEELGVEKHLRHCDLCVSGVMRMQPHLRTAGGVGMHIPTALRSRAGVSAQRQGAARRRAAFVLRWPVLIPTSLAAGFLLGISVAVVRHAAVAPVMTRAVESTEVRATVGVDGPLRRAPVEDAEAVSNLRVGEEVTVIERRVDWTRVVVSGGRQGWIRSEDLR